MLARFAPEIVSDVDLETKVRTVMQELISKSLRKLAELKDDVQMFNDKIKNYDKTFFD